MNIGIIEICVDGHYMIVNTLVKTYLEDHENNIFVYTTPFVINILKSELIPHPRIHLTIMENDVNEVFDNMSKDQLDRVHFNSVTKYYKSFLQFSERFNGRIFFHFHNIDLWFMSSFSWEVKRISSLLGKIDLNSLFRELKYSIKLVFIGLFKRKFIRYLFARENTVFVVLSNAQNFHLRKYINKPIDLIVFPSIIFEKNKYKDLSLKNKKLRVCIPGSVSTKRRQYYELFKVIRDYKSFFAQNITFDFLGFLPIDELKVEGEIKSLIKDGIDILYYKTFINDDDFDENLFKSDVVLSNIHVISNTDSPQNKETATVFNLIRCGKPGLFPVNFILDDVFNDSVLKFDNYNDLKSKLEKLHFDRSALSNLKEKAYILSEKYSARELLKVLQ